VLEEIRRLHKRPQRIEKKLLGDDSPDRIETEKPARKIIKEPVHVRREFR
jgi:hypothetical protein